MTRLPLDVALVGVPKSGTTSLFEWLAAHPGIQGSDPKESLFFVGRTSELFVWNGPETSWPTFEADGWRGFEHFFPESRAERVRLEATPTNLFNPIALEALAALDPKPLVIAVLRDPAEQIRSAFYFAQNNGAAGAFIDADLDFATYVRELLDGNLQLEESAIPHPALREYFAGTILDHGRYVEWWDRYAERFPPDRMMLLRFQDLAGEPRNVLSDICHRIALDGSFYDDYPFPHENPTIARRRDRLDRWGYRVRAKLPSGPLRRKLTALYKEFRPAPPIHAPQDAELAALESLRRYFAPSNSLLSERYGIEVSSWMPERADESTR